MYINVTGSGSPTYYMLLNYHLQIQVRFLAHLHYQLAITETTLAK